MSREERLQEERLAEDRARIERNKRQQEQVIRMFMLAFGRKQ